MVGRTNAISLRLSEEDREKLRAVAERLDVRETDVLRYAIDLTLSRLGPLLDTGAAGADLLPVFVESGAELFRSFSIDSSRLERIINSELAEEARRVDPRDISLLVRSFREEAATIVHLHALLGSDASGEEGLASLRRRFREYLYNKYLFQRSDGDVVDNAAIG